MGKKENIEAYYKKKYFEKKQTEYFEKKQKEREDSYYKPKQMYEGNWDKALHNCWIRAPNFKGYLPEFKARMESLFTNGMTWENYPEWEVDHIVPLNKGGSHSVENLQPLWMAENRAKKDKTVN